MSAPNRHPAGVPAGGQFAVSRRAEAEVSLIDPATESGRPAPVPATALPRGWEPNPDYPLPQCDDLHKIPAVLDAIEAGADTPESISIALGMTSRQGSYYANGAGYLGLAEVDRSTSPNTWTLTGVGEHAQSGAAEDRAAMLSQMVASLPEAAYIDSRDGRDDYLAEAEGSGLSSETAERRANTMRSWRRHAAHHGEFALAISESSDRVAVNIDSARANAAEERRKSAEKPGPVYNSEVCPTCFQQKAVNGSCGCY